MPKQWHKRLANKVAHVLRAAVVSLPRAELQDAGRQVMCRWGSSQVFMQVCKIQLSLLEKLLIDGLQEAAVVQQGI